MPDSIAGQTAVCGLGVTAMGKIYGHDTTWFAAEAIKTAVEDAGIEKDQIDGLLINAGITGYTGTGIGIPLQNHLGLHDLRLLNHMNSYGATASGMIQYAAFAVHHGMANYVANTGYALAARRYMETFGVDQDKLGHVAVAQRQWAALNPQATMRDSLTLEDYHNSRWIIEPFHLLDCCLVSNGAVAVIVTTAERAQAAKSDPAYVLGMGQGHPGNLPHAEFETLTTSGASLAGKTAFNMAGLIVDDVDVCEFYDCYTYTVLRTLEDYGFCGKGEAGDFVADGRTAPGGSFALNTGGGQLSSFYMWGMTPVAEGVAQARGSAGERQVDKHDVVLISGNGGTLDTHGTLVLSPRQN